MNRYSCVMNLANRRTLYIILGIGIAAISVGLFFLLL